MSRNQPATEVDPSEGGLDDASKVGESSANEREEQVDPSEGSE
jgi:hypothetical protein